MKTKKLTLLLLLIFTLACGSFSVITEATEAPMAEETEPDISAELSAESEQINARMDSFITSETPGGTVMVIQNGQVVHRNGYGLANLEDGTAMTPDKIFHLGSVGKQFTAMGILILAEQGLLTLDDPIGDHLSELAWTGDEVTIRSLLQHTSGIPDYDENSDLLDRLMELADEPTNQDVLAVLSEETELIYATGDQFLYSNTGYDVLGALIESASGQYYAEFMKENIFAPLGMNNTFALPNANRLTDPNISMSYVFEDGEPTAYPSDPIDNINGSGSIYSNLDDMVLYDQALYTDKIVSQSTLAEAFQTGILNNGEETEYGFAWDIGNYQGEDYTAHSGAWLGFYTYYLRFPAQELSVLVLFNYDYSDPDPETLAYEIADLYLK